MLLPASGPLTPDPTTKTSQVGKDFPAAAAPASTMNPMIPSATPSAKVTSAPLPQAPVSSMSKSTAGLESRLDSPVNTDPASQPGPASSQIINAPSETKSDSNLKPSLGFQTDNKYSGAVQETRYNLTSSSSLQQATIGGYSIMIHSAPALSTTSYTLSSTRDSVT